MEQINIIQLVEKNPITRLSKEYENSLINKVKNGFSETQQQMFLASFYCYLNYDSKKDFIIDFDNVWKWTGFSRKSDAKRVLEKHFTIDIDYQIKTFGTATSVAKNKAENETQKPAPPTCGAGFEDENKLKKPATPTSAAGQNSFAETSVKENIKNEKNLGGAGLNKENIFLNIITFKKFCMKANTKKADEILDYYIKLEELLQETIDEQTNELRYQLCAKEEECIDKDNQLILKETELREEKVIRTKLKQKYELFLKKRIDIDNNYEKGNMVYMIGCEELPDLVRIGCTDNFAKRYLDYNILPFEIQTYYTRYVPYESRIVEQMLHAMFNKYRIKNSKEYFKVENQNKLFFKEDADKLIDFLENIDKKYKDVRDIKLEKYENIIERHEKENQERQQLEKEKKKEPIVFIDNVKEFFDNTYEITTSSNDIVPQKELYPEYKEYCLKNNVQSVLNPTFFSSFKKQHYYNATNNIENVYINHKGVFITNLKKKNSIINNELIISETDNDNLININELITDTYSNSDNNESDSDESIIDSIEDNLDNDKNLNKYKCVKCQIYLDKENFCKNKRRKTGLSNTCKICAKKKYDNKKESTKIILNEKKCSKCNTMKNIDEFYKRVGSSDGKTSECKLCSNKMYYERRDKRKQEIEIEVTEKQCKDCKKVLLVNAFDKKTDSIDGYNSFCKDCISIQNKNKRLVKTNSTSESEKICNCCNILLSIEKFWNSKSNNDGKYNKCSDCCKKQKTKRKEIKTDIISTITT
jgi:hypothetical protein